MKLKLVLMFLKWVVEALRDKRVTPEEIFALIAEIEEIVMKREV